jgi:release factor glutamine methyltransferase
MTATLPDLNHLFMKDFEAVYEPSDDTFLLCDAIEADKEIIAAQGPNIAIEIGCEFFLE